ncbi:MAG: FecR family protein, partial [Gemmatimonadaceae bacterium]
MTSAFTTIAPDDLILFTQGDEASLERIFRLEYDPLVALATTELEESSAAPRLVEGVFYDAWQQRARFASPGDLAHFLRDAVHREALRERGRHAALHRFHDREGAATARVAPAVAPVPVGVDGAWAALVGALHAPPPDAARGADVRHDLSRHEAASHLAKVAAPERNVRGILLMIAVAAVVLVFIVGMMRWLGAANPGSRVDAALERSDARVVSTQSAQRATVPLADGSRAVLGPDSQLRIPLAYGETLRAVGLVGTAAFTVAEQTQPFFVKAGAARVRATGTVFDVSTFTDAGTIVRVREGTVEVTAGDSTHAVATGEALLVSDDGSMSTPAETVLDESLAWTDGRFVIADRP